MKKLFTLVILGLSLAPLAANAQLAHRYSFNGNANDSVGTANGTLTGSDATISATMLTTTGANNSSYVSLPASVGTGITGNFTIQDFTSSPAGATQSYSSLFSFATQGSDHNFILFNAYRPNTAGTSADFSQGTTGGNEVDVNAGSPLLANGLEHDIVLTYNATSGLVSIYNNGALAGTGNIGAGFNFSLTTTGTFDGINGNGPFGDNSYNGSTDDFRIYGQALTASQVAAIDALGANATNAQIGAALVPEPSTWALLSVGVGLLGLSIHRRSTLRA